MALALSLLLSIAAPLSDAAPAVAAAEASKPGTATASAGAADPRRVEDLEKQVENLEGLVQLVVTPLGILAAVIALGGTVGIVFSIRDQRRVGQLHSLAVASEVSGQRRTDESYTLFLDASQRTLTLVNDTLELAREATERAAHTMELKAASSLGTIEQEAQKLLLPLLEAGEFEVVVENREHRERLQAIAGDLSSLEGYLLLQDIDLHPYSRFVKGIDHHLKDETPEALQTLLRGAQDMSVRELQRFSHYWVGYLRNTIGEHKTAADAFEMAKENLTENTIQNLELDRVIAESRFFELAVSEVPGGARARYAMVEHLLLDLEGVARRLYEHDHKRSTAASHEVAATRAALLTWIAYEPAALVRRVPEDALSSAGSAAVEEVSGMTALTPALAAAAWQERGDTELRAWALRQVDSLYRWQEDVRGDFAIFFGLAECDYALRIRDGIEGYEGANEMPDVERYRDLERMALDRLPWHREPRETAELAYAVFICRGRLHALRLLSRDPQVGSTPADLTSAYADVQRALSAIGDGSITVYSHLQKRPLSHTEFQTELESFEKQVIDLKGDEL